MDGTISWNKLRAAEKAKVIQLALDNGVSDINTIRDTYNIYSKELPTAHIKEPKPGESSKLGTVSSLWKIATNSFTDTEKEIIRNNLAKNLYPVGYNHAVSRFWNAGIKNEKEKYRQWVDERIQNTQDPTFAIRMALYSKALNDKDTGVKFEDYFVESPYKPVQSSNPNAIYYTLKPDVANIEHLYQNLGDYTMGQGQDDRGKYYSIYDLWDINPGKQGNKVNDKIGIFNPVEIYDRVYEDSPLYNSVEEAYNYWANERGISENGNVVIGPGDNSIPLLMLFSKGGKIHIDPSKRGTFTAAATKHGKSVQEFARQVLANKDNYSPAMVRKAVFAHNSKSWKHSTGGPLYPFSFSKNPYIKTPDVRYADGGNLFGHTFDGDTESQITYTGANAETVPFNLFDLKSWKYHGSPSYGNDFSFAQAFTDAVAQQAPYFKWGEGMYNTNINWSKRFAKTDDGKKPFKEFAETMYPAVISVLQENNYPIDMADNIVRQAALESDYGMKDVGGKGYNLSGIKWFNTMPDRKHATNPRDGLEYIDFDDLHDYLNFKVQLLNNRYDALNATSTQDFIDRLHPKASGRNKKGRDYSGNYESYKTNLPRTSSLNKFLNSLIIKTE